MIESKRERESVYVCLDRAGSIIFDRRFMSFWLIEKQTHIWASVKHHFTQNHQHPNPSPSMKRTSNSKLIR